MFEQRSYELKRSKSFLRITSFILF